MSTNTVLITGCSSGFGKLTAETFQARGWNVVATMRTPSKSKGLSSSDTMLVTRLDVNDPASIDEAVERGRARFGEIDVLVNNAGFGTNAMFEQSSDADIRAMFETNVFGLMNTSKAVLPHMRTQGSGCIINVTSMAGLIGLPGNSVYCASKFAVEGLTEALAQEYRDLGINVKSIAPGAFASTAFTDNVTTRVSDGDAQLRDYSEKLRAHFTSLTQEGGPQNPQLVADKIFECATETTPVHNPVGIDAEGLVKAMNSVDSRETFIQMMAGRLLPPS
ncbi:MAG: SDR family oxidoreductase [Pseudomonadota bacterium]